MSVAKNIVESIDRSSWIRRMFEEGARLKSEFGDENVFDFSLGNPDLEPPEEFFSVMQELISSKAGGVHGYMPNAGFPKVRSSIAEKVSRDHEIEISSDAVVMTCGAAGGLNAVLKTILDHGDEVIVPKPYFVEYNFYVANHGGKIKLVETNDDFSLNIDAIRKAVGKKTKAVLINTPNNPTGKVYTGIEIQSLATLLNGYLEKGQAIYLICDEPYREIIYTGDKVATIMNNYSQSIVVNSYSKSLSIPGERIGYVAVNPQCRDFKMLMAGIILCNRILGYVNAPALMQRIVAELNDVSVDVEAYKKRRDTFSEGLRSIGYAFTQPEGAFYIFCKSPVEDDVAFVRHLQKYNILVVPGVGFGGPGYFRIAYCVPVDIIERSLPKFREALGSL